MKGIHVALMALAAMLAWCLLTPHAASSNGAGQEDAEDQVIFVFIRIPESIMPLDRAEKYEEPIDASLRGAGVGEVTGGGSQLGEVGENGERSIEWVGIDVDLIDLSVGLTLLRSELKRLGAPTGTTIEYERNGESVSEAS